MQVKKKQAEQIYLIMKCLEKEIKNNDFKIKIRSLIFLKFILQSIKLF